MNHSVKIRLLAMFLAIVMVIGYLPTSVFAEETELEDVIPETTSVVEETIEDESVNYTVNYYKLHHYQPLQPIHMCYMHSQELPH